jgi:hypothetical protein
MLGRHGRCSRNTPGRREVGRATRCVPPGRNRASRNGSRPPHRSPSISQGLARGFAILTLVTTPAGSAVRSTVAAAAPHEPFVSRAPASSASADREGRAVARPPARGPAPSGRRTLPTCGHMSPPLHAKLNASFRLAVRSVREVPACRALFQGLGASGEGRLSRTLYEHADGRGIDVCFRRHATAFTRVGISTTWICPAFEQLVSVDGALTLIHEALHFAGLPESPGTPGAPTAAQIHHMVRTSCDPTQVR